MNGEVDKLERTVERELELLGELPLVAPRRECLERVKAAVAAEAVRVARAYRTPGGLRVGIGVAAALLLAVGLATRPPQPDRPAALDAEATLRAWAAAWDESSSRLTSLLDEGWNGGVFGPDADAELDDLFRSLDQSFDRFESL